MRKYDKRKNNGRYKSQVKRGPKPLYLQHMSRNAAGNHLKTFDGIATWEQVYKEAWDKGDYALCASIRFRCEDRLYGKPFTAENPEAKGKGNVVFNDNRLQMAIQTLLPHSAAPGVQKLARTRRKALPAAVTVEASPDAKAETAEQSEGD
jgi:hypothetical protein